MEKRLYLGNKLFLDDSILSYPIDLDKQLCKNVLNFHGVSEYRRKVDLGNVREIHFLYSLAYFRCSSSWG